MLDIKKRVAKFLYYLEKDQLLISNAKSLSSNELDIKYINDKYIDLHILYNEYLSFIDGIFDLSYKEFLPIEWYELGKKLGDRC